MPLFRLFRFIPGVVSVLVLFISFFICGQAPKASAQEPFYLNVISPAIFGKFPEIKISKMSVQAPSASARNPFYLNHAPSPEIFGKAPASKNFCAIANSVQKTIPVMPVVSRGDIDEKVVPKKIAPNAPGDKAENAAPIVAATPQKKTNPPPQADLSKNKKAHSSGGGIGKPGPIAAKTKKVDGKRVCKTSRNHPEKSDRNRKGHIDAECCLDPDETPNSRCYYPPERYGKLLKKYLDRQ